AEAAKTFCHAYLITPKGNFEHGTSNPAFADGSMEVREQLAPAREKLLAVRNERPQPGKDTKILLAWNALIIRGIATAAVAFDRKDWFTAARKAADFLWENLRGNDGSFFSVYYEGVGPKVSANLDDIAWLAEANLALAAWADWHDAGTAKVYTERAEALVELAQKHFCDEREAGYYFTADNAEELVSRKKVWFDNATPSGNASLLHSLSVLYALSAKSEYRDEFEQMRVCYPGMAERAPSAVAHALSAYTADATGIAVIKVKGTTDLTALHAALTKRPWRRVFIQLTDDSAQPDGYLLCVGTQCLEPTSDPEELAERL
ncbi:MAG: hypothetical protein AAGF10_04420, partial [Verrucomicrobiota bacterium]